MAKQIESRGYRLVVIDTFSRAISGDQNDVVEMTEWLTPLQEIAHSQISAIILIDHHKKRGDHDRDVIADILGSTGKGAMADTILGLYRERGKAGAKIAVTGREVEERTMNIYFDTPTGCWQLDSSDEAISGDDQELLAILEELGIAGDTQIAKKCDPERRAGTVHKQLSRLEDKGLVRKSGGKWEPVDPISAT
jgi:predicted transcriptional regulator